jgi:hypothetical protein
MKKLAQLIAAGCLSLAALSANADGVNFYTGNTLMNLVSSDDRNNVSFDSGVLIGFIAGTVDANSAAWDISGTACIPHGVSLIQLKEIFKKYLKENPQQWHAPGVVLLGYALGKSFPCTRK